MKNIFLKLSLVVTSVFWSGNGVMAAMLQMPLQATAGVVPPNLMFTLDDSGSMDYHCLPESLCHGNVDAVRDSTSNSNSKIVTYDVNNIFNRKMRSAEVNFLYYNPAVLYLPWLKVDGTRYPQYIGTAARDFPEIATSTTVLNLASVQNISSIWCTGAGTCPASASQSVYMAQYFKLTGNANVDVIASYTPVKIESGKNYGKSIARKDCIALPNVCTYSEELQNFSNWYSYHRTRMRVAIAGTAEAFYSIPGSYRVGYGRINKTTATDIDGLGIRTVEKGIRPFTNTIAGNKDDFYTWLFKQKPSGSTPLRRAMDDVGQYYSYTDNRGPWGEDPGANNTASQLSCRRSFHVLMTDGLWNGSGASTAGAQGNVDNSAGPTITGPGNQSYTYAPGRPYRDGASGTLADIAMYYWNRDLNPGLTNGVAPSSGNPAFWQHMVNYTISFGALGTLNPATDLPGLINGTKSWPAAGADKVENIDDLWHAAVNSRGKYLAANNTTEYSNALKGIIDDIAAINGSEAGVAVSAKTLSTTSINKKYEAEFSSARWSGDVKALNLTSTGADNGDPEWTAVGNFPAYGARNIFTYDKTASGTKGIAFTWANLTSAMQTTLLGGSSLNGTNLVNYLRGDRSNEAGTYRPRASVLGDIVNSTPILIKDQADGQYGFLPKTSANLIAAQSTYRRFLAAKKLRNPQLFVGANDGMLHAFSDVDGAETFAFMPDSVLGNVKALAGLDYSHQYFVDGPLTEADIYDASASKWRNLVLGGTGAGAKSLFAINVPVVSYPSDATTAPAALTVAQSAPGAADILWSISSADTTDPKNFSELGYVLQAPEQGVMRDGSWVVIVGNGYESTSRRAQLFVINALTGAVIKKLDTGVGSSGTPNGLGGARVVRNANKQIVAVYAGDLQGNLWKFDFSSTDPANWAVAFGGNPLYSTAAVEQITAAPTYTVHPSGGLMVLFGTGKLHETGDEGVTAQRALYGVWDMVNLGAASSTAADRITQQATIVPQAFSSLALTNTTGIFYGLTVTPVDYAIKPTTETRPAYMTKRGWRLPLTIGSGQRLVDNPEMAGGMVFMQTVTPSSNQAACIASNLTRYGFMLDPFMKKIEQAAFDTNADNAFSSVDQITAAGVLLVGSGPATIQRESMKNRFRLSQARTGLGQNPVTQGGQLMAKRYWRQVNSR